MSFKRYMSFARPDGRAAANARILRIDLYFYGDRIDIIRQGGMDTIQPEGGVTLARIEEAMAVMRAQGYRLTSDVDHSRHHPRPRKAALAR